jgi:hypothetical protein
MDMGGALERKIICLGLHIHITEFSTEVPLPLTYFDHFMAQLFLFTSEIKKEKGIKYKAKN